MNASTIALASALLLCTATGWTRPQSDSKQVQFRNGQTTITLSGRLKGDRFVDYRLRGYAGQSILIRLKPGNRSVYFNVMPPRSDDEAIFVGSTSGGEFSADLSVSGEYTIRVYLMRNAARRNESATYTLDVALSGDARPSAHNEPRERPRATTDSRPAKWDASGTVRCSFGNDQFDQQCGFRVVRNLRKKSADIWIRNAAKGPSDYLYLHYADNAFTTNDASKLAWQRRQDNWWISVNGHEFYFIPDALIHGG